MAYVHYHTLQFQNRITGDVSIEMHKKDGTPSTEVTQLTCTYAKKQYAKGNGERFDTIITSELLFSIWLPFNSPYTYDDFIVSFHDEWKVILYNEGNVEFIGYLTPGEGTAQFRDLPYLLELTANDGLGFLKTDDISKVNGDAFIGTDTLIQYLAGILAKTRLQLNIRTYCSIYDASMPDRNADPQSDVFNLAKLDFRTFMDDDSEYLDCYTALEYMLYEGFNICQWAGRWTIVRIGELQESAGPKLWYTEYDYAGNTIDAQLEGFDAGVVAKDQVLHPRNADAQIGAMYAIKYAKHTYNYNVWPEIPLNDSFEHGEMFEQGDAPDTNDFDGDGDTGEIIGTYKKYTIDDWVFGITNISSPSTYPPTGMSAPGVDKAYRYSIYDEYGTEISREIVLERNGEIAGHRYLVCSPIPVMVNSKVTISFDYRINQSGTGNKQYLLVALISNTGQEYRLTNAGGGAPADGVGTLVWQPSESNVFLSKNYGTGENFNVYTSFSIPAPSFPVSGELYICYCMYDPAVGQKVYYKALEVEYKPYIAGGLVEVKGDSWKTTQDVDYKDDVDEEVYLSDSPEKVFKGALLQNDGVTLTSRTWHRLNVNENRDYKELINLARYNAAYRRCKRITGTFGGTTCRPLNAATEVEPLSFHRHYTFPNDATLGDKYFVLVPPLTVNYSEGLISATFVEALDTQTNDGNELGNTHEFKYIF